ncbi:MAG TPA: UvrD-helicase domain-containing protein, partial [Gemmatimonadaceae bacterium]
HAVDPRFNVALEASAGTGKTRVLVDRYINLLRAGVDPSNILAITFTKKAAAEMRERIITALRKAAASGEIQPARWRELRDRLADIAISTIDAFCLSLLREFPLEADLDPDFSLADETEVPRLIDESLDRALRICRAVAHEDGEVALVFAQIGERRARAGLAALLHRRLVAPLLLSKYLASAPSNSSVEIVSERAAHALFDVFASMPGGLDRFLASGPVVPLFRLLSRNLLRLKHGFQNGPTDPVALQVAFARSREHFLTQDGEPRSRLPYPKAAFSSERHWQIHRDMVVQHAERVIQVSDGYRRDLNVLVSRGVWRMFQIAVAEYRRTLDSHGLLDFSDLLGRALDLLRQMEEFARSRYRLESRYHHLLVDEFQDTSRPQWELISLLIQSWGEGAGLADGPLQPSIFIVGDRKQSIYGFRDADVSILREASRHLEVLRPDGGVRRSISRSFRAVPALLSFVNDLCQDVEKANARRDAFQYQEEDRFPVDDAIGDESLGLISANSVEECADKTAGEIERLISTGTLIRDRASGLPRAIGPGDVAILFRSRESHREFEDALDRRGIAAYIYKGLGFFDAEEVKDVLALLWYLADPLSNLRTAAFLRSRFVRLTDEAIQLLAPALADALLGSEVPAAALCLDPTDA